MHLSLRQMYLYPGTMSSRFCCTSAAHATEVQQTIEDMLPGYVYIALAIIPQCGQNGVWVHRHNGLTIWREGNRTFLIKMLCIVYSRKGIEATMPRHFVKGQV